MKEGEPHESTNPNHDTPIPVTRVEVICDPEKTGIELTLGNNRPTLISKIKLELSGMRNEMVR